MQQATQVAPGALVESLVAIEVDPPHAADVVDGADTVGSVDAPDAADAADV